jgi:hypothetical protein
MIHRRRRTTVIALPVLLALATTAAIAWASALLITYPSVHTPIRNEALSDREWWSLAHKRAPAARRYQSVVMIRAFEYEPLPQTGPLPRWATLPAPASRPDFLNDSHYEIADARGWPLPALSFRFHGRGSSRARTGEITGGIPLSPNSTGAWHDPRALPLTPIWPGLLANTALFALLWATLLYAPGAVRRKLRRRDGRCTSCGYDLRATPARAPCPECGAIAPPPLLNPAPPPTAGT